MKRSFRDGQKRGARKSVKGEPPTAVPPIDANRQVVQTFASPDDPTLTPTRDPADRAHGVRGADGRLLPAGVGKHPARKYPNPAVAFQGVKARVYPRCHVNGAGLGVDSQYDGLYEAQRRLAGIPGLGLDFQDDEAEERLWQRAIVLDRAANRRKQSRPSPRNN